MNQPASGAEPEEFEYKGKRVSISQEGDQATISIDDQTYEAARGPRPVWRVPGVFNLYTSPSELARHMVDYLHLMPPGKKQGRRSGG